jgi:hypothetical protein
MRKRRDPLLLREIEGVSRHAYSQMTPKGSCSLKEAQVAKVEQVEGSERDDANAGWRQGVAIICEHRQRRLEAAWGQGGRVVLAS